ncbi:transmembrane protein, putative, partial [Rhizoctonia solani AG-3 Rhs1AP]
MSADHHDHDLDAEPPKRTGLPPVAKYICGAAFALSAGLAIPFFYAKSRTAGPKAGLHISRGVSAGPGATLLGRPSHLSPQLSLPTRKAGPKPQDEVPADTLGAIKHAVKALGVATLVVGTTTGVGVVGVMVGLGITTIGEFHTLMRSLVRSSFPELHETLHSVPDTTVQGRVEVWGKERVEQALEEAYATGGVQAWIDEARRQLERERAVAQKVAEWQSRKD